MGRKKATVNYLIVDDLSVPPEDQKGTLIAVEGRRNTEANRQKALDKAIELWQEGQLEGFADGLSLENVIFAPGTSGAATETYSASSEEELPLQKAARDVITLIDLLIHRGEAIQEATPLLPILEAAEKGQKLTEEQTAQARDRSFSKILTRLATSVTEHQTFVETPGVMESIQMIIAIIQDDRLITPEQILPPASNETEEEIEEEDEDDSP
ncbi:MAG: hypothetical protein J7540_09750 [Roseofilum sp. SID2]|uniref:hypothetical protein n=1 Tax=unclassified Roseofilum TaxID=2620099 RepID=UPI001B1F721A|nr:MULTISPECIES: hypothetical protein [unclassified Roseofilum]MBP0012556.1 hypothetical protein [Roseofilum sp. SID3]MBP0024266.1 hypothetical protein [Roseofilum sp. SID2]MBP0040173.1 hypothetical protein [Roseofilum sp. SID1]